MVCAISSFRNANPKTYAAFIAAMKQAVKIIHNDKQKAAEIYLDVSRSKEPMEWILRMLKDLDVEFM